MLLPILQMSLSNPTPASFNLSSFRVVSDPTNLFLTSRFSHLSIAKLPKTTTIRMGGGPRTYPGGVSKWQWKRMQAKKAKQLLRARLARERQVYEMRKRAELSAAVAELERPWEVVEKAPKLFSTSADEQLKVLADRFQKPGGFDLWSEKDGPQLFETVDGVPSARFFPKGVVHSIKPYGRITDGYSNEESGLVQKDAHDENSRKIKNNGRGIGYRFPEEHSVLESGFPKINGHHENSRIANGKSMKNGNRRRIDMEDEGVGYHACDENSGPESGLPQRNGHGASKRNANGRLKKMDSRRIRTAATRSDLGDDGLNQRENGSHWRRDTKRGNGRKERSALNSKVFDMNLQDDGSYGISKREIEMAKIRLRTDTK